MHTRFGKEKLTTEVTYPDILEDFQSITSSTEGHDEPGSYELIGIICHSGNLTGGHYVAHCKSIEDGQWYLFNDSHVSPSKSQGHGYGAYLLFYSKLHSL